jgi:hypothetical protein
MKAAAAFALALAGSVACAQSPAPAPQKVESTAKIVPAPQARTPGTPIASADELLIALENAGNGMRQLQAELRRTKILPDIDGGGQQEWSGRVLFENPLPKAPGQPVKRRFQIEFDYSIRDRNVKQNDGQIFIFDGEWLIERTPAAKQMTRTQLVPPGQNIDPLSLENGVFPLPIGQKREGILEKFEAEFLDPLDFKNYWNEKLPEDLKGLLKDTYQLKLTPKPGTPGAKSLREIRIWYRKADLLPRMAFTEEFNGTKNEYLLAEMKVNTPLPKNAFDSSVPPGWDVQTTEYRANAPGKSDSKDR